MSERNLPDEVARIIVESAPDALVMVDDEGRIVLANRQAELMFGYDRNEMLLRPIETLLPDDRREDHERDRAEYMAAPRVRAMGVAQNLRGRMGSGDTFPIEVSLSPIESDGQRFVLAAVRNVRERRQAQEELAEARRRSLLLEDRERVGRDLHDTVIQELFATGMQLQAAKPSISEPAAVERVGDAIDSIDRTIKQIRETIFGLTGLAPSGHAARDRIEAVVQSFTDVLGFTPGLDIDGDIDAVSGAVTEHLVPTVREALANAARHARASEVVVSVMAGDDSVRLGVVDDGIGILGPTQRLGGYGLRNMQERAEALGGSLRVEAHIDGGTSLEWVVPLQPPAL